MNPGRLNKRVKIQRPVYNTAAGSGEQSILRWDNVAEVWATVEPFSGREYFAAAQTQSSVTHKITIRYRSGIDQTMRVLFKERQFYIESVINPNERNEFLQLVCVEGTT